MSHTILSDTVFRHLISTIKARADRSNSVNGKKATKMDTVAANNNTMLIQYEAGRRSLVNQGKVGQYDRGPETLYLAVTQPFINMETSFVFFH